MKKIFFFFVINIMFLGSVFGQLTSNGIFSQATQDTFLLAEGTIFIFKTGSSIQLTAQSRDTAIKTHAYIWTHFDSSKTDFSDTLRKETSFSSTITNATVGNCYKVNIIDSLGKDSAYYAWVFYDNISFKIDSIRSTCTSFALKLNNVILDTIAYYDLTTKEKRTLANKPNIVWKYAGQESDVGSNHSFNASAPVDTTTFYATLTNSYKNTHTESYKSWKPIATKAEFVVDTSEKNPYAKDYYKLKDPIKGGAPFAVPFINKSKNGERFEWIFLDKFEKDNFTDCTYKPIPQFDTTYKNAQSTRSDPKDSSYSVFYSPGKYTVKLVSINSTCDPDTFTLRSSEATDISIYSLEVLKSKESGSIGDVKSAIPQVFRPDGDENSNFRFNLSSKENGSFTTSTWYVAESSIRNMKLKIFDRWGKIVYEYNGALEWPDGEEGGWEAWKGWNGKKDNTGGECAAGIYYYAIEMQGWDDEYYKDVRALSNSKKTPPSTSPTVPNDNKEPLGGGGGDYTNKKARKTPQFKDTKSPAHTGFVYLFR